jgi:hypothetical protein
VTSYYFRDHLVKNKVLFSVHIEVEARGETDLLDISQALNIINKPELTKHTDKYGSPDLAAVWLHEEKIGGLEFECGDQVRVKTKGDGPLVCMYRLYLSSVPKTNNFKSRSRCNDKTRIMK